MKQELCGFVSYFLIKYDKELSITVDTVDIR